MTKVMDFFKPSWKKIYWLLLVFFVAEVYHTLIISAVPTSVLSNFVSFILNPFSMLFTQTKGIDVEIIVPFAKTLDLLWMYFVATILAKEVSKDKD